MEANSIIERLTDADQIEMLHTVVNEMASNGLRIICVAYRDLIPRRNLPADRECFSFNYEVDTISNLTCSAIFGIGVFFQIGENFAWI